MGASFINKRSRDPFLDCVLSAGRFDYSRADEPVVVDVLWHEGPNREEYQESDSYAYCYPEAHPSWARQGWLVAAVVEVLLLMFWGLVCLYRLIHESFLQSIRS